MRKFFEQVSDEIKNDELSIGYILVIFMSTFGIVASLLLGWTIYLAYFAG